MEYIADFHLHSRHSRATSNNITLENLEKYARIKGLNVIGTGDFQHPKWFEEITSSLTEDENGILYSKTGFPFVWQTEISLMFSQGGKRRAVHIVVLCPGRKTAEKIIAYLSSKGRLDYDGRPIFGISARDFVEDLKEIDEKIELIPAHCMTPWFGIYGSDSGFDSLQECFLDQASKIFAIESGMSADPEMLWRFKENARVVSFSDAHSFWPWRMGREATIFELDKLSYDNIISAIRTGRGLKGTIETPPEYGKYHWDGHRNCNFSSSPEKTKSLNRICPVCGKEMTIGVDYRVEEIAKEKKGFKPENSNPFYKLLPLHEVIALYLNTSLLTSKKIAVIYDKFISNFQNEFKVLLSLGREELERAFPDDKKLVELILLNREGKIKVQPGYDGEYGKALLEDSDKLVKKESQKKLL